MLTAQLESFGDIQARRQKVWAHYDDSLAGWAEQRGVAMPTVEKNGEQPAHLYFLLLPTHDEQQRAPQTPRRQRNPGHVPLCAAGLDALWPRKWLPCMAT